jgi:hypothetical protein
VGSVCLLAGACSSSPKACTSIGAESGVVVNLDHGVLPTTGLVLLRACVNGVCNSQGYTSRPRLTTRLWVPVTPVPTDAEVHVSVRVTSSSQLVFAGSTRAHSYKNQPNGPGCDPTVWDVGVIAHNNQSLMPHR